MPRVPAVQCTRLRLVALLTCGALSAVLLLVLRPALYRLEDVYGTWLPLRARVHAAPTLTGPGPAVGLPDAEWELWSPFSVRRAGEPHEERARPAQATAAPPPQPAAGGRRRGGAAPMGITLQAAERAAARVSPDIFAELPPAFLPGYKSPCWRSGGNGTGPLRCLPYFQALGVFQCGVRDLMARILMHPDVAATANAAPHFWDEIHDFSWYLDIMARALPAVEANPERAVFGDGSLATFTFTWTGSERLHAEWTAEMRRCREKDCDGAKQPCVDDTCYDKAHAVGVGGGVGLTLPWLMRAALGAGNCKLLVLLRDPVERLHASFWFYQHYRDKYGASEAGFTAFALEMVGHVERCLAAGHGQVACVTAFESLGPEEENVFYHADQVLKGMYSVFMEGWLDAFPREDLLVLRLEDYAADGEVNAAALRETLQQVLSHLGLSPPDEALWARMLAAPVTRNGGAPQRAVRSTMDADTRTALRAFYAPFNARLSELLGDDAKWRWEY